MKLILFIPILLLIIPISYAANWVDDPDTCPVEYNSVSCTGGEKMCGINTAPDPDQPYCYDMTTINPPTSNETTTSNNIAGFDGGFYLNCEDTSQGSEPYCFPSASDCDYNTTCYNTYKKQTICLENQWATTDCGDCRSNYFACDGSEDDGDGCEIQSGVSCGSSTGTIQHDECFDANNGNCTRNSDYLDCDNDDSDGDQLTCNGANGCEVNPYTTSCDAGNNNHLTDCTTCYCDSNYYDCDSTGVNESNGCELQDGSSCTVGAVSGTYDCVVGAGSCYATNGGTEYTCTCVVDPVSYGTSGVKYNWSGTSPFLWFQQYGAGMIINLTNSDNITSGFDSSGCVWVNNTQHCSFTNGSGDGIGYTSTNLTTDWIFDNSGIVTYNESKMNDTIDARDTDTDTNESTRVNTIMASWLNSTTSFGGEVSGTYDTIVLSHTALDDQYIELGDSFAGEVSGTYDAIVLDHDALDDQYYDSESDLTSLLDDNYQALGNYCVMNTTNNGFINITSNLYAQNASFTDDGAIIVTIGATESTGASTSINLITNDTARAKLRIDGSGLGFHIDTESQTDALFIDKTGNHTIQGTLSLKYDGENTSMIDNDDTGDLRLDSHGDLIRLQDNVYFATGILLSDSGDIESDSGDIDISDPVSIAAELNMTGQNITGVHCIQLFNSTGQPSGKICG